MANIAELTAQIGCPHGGQVNAAPGSSRVKLGGQPIALSSDTFNVAGCPFTVPAGAAQKPQPCVRVQWLVTSTRIKVEGQPVILQNSTGLCLSAEQIPQGPPAVKSTQSRVRGT